MASSKARRNLKRRWGVSARLHMRRHLSWLHPFPSRGKSTHSGWPNSLPKGQVGLASQAHREQADALVQGQSTLNLDRNFLKSAHPVVHGRSHQTESNGLVPHNGLVVALAVPHCLFSVPP